MRNLTHLRLSVLALCAASFMGSVAYSQAMPGTTPGATVTAPLSAEDQSASPFPAGRHAALVKKVCTACHSAQLVLDQRFGREDAERFYKNMVSKDLSTDQARMVIDYLSTTLGQ